MKYHRYGPSPEKEITSRSSAYWGVIFCFTVEMFLCLYHWLGDTWKCSISTITLSKKREIALLQSHDFQFGKRKNKSKTASINYRYSVIEWNIFQKQNREEGCWPPRLCIGLLSSLNMQSRTNSRWTWHRGVWVQSPVTWPISIQLASLVGVRPVGDHTVATQRHY